MANRTHIGIWDRERHLDEWIGDCTIRRGGDELGQDVIRNRVVHMKGKERRG